MSDTRRWWWIAMGLVLFGLGLRAYQFFRAPDVWQDEAALLVNVLGNDYTQLLGPLVLNQAAPPLFLWAERTMALTFGDGPTVARLLPFLASALALVLLVPVSRRLLTPTASLWAIFLFAASEQLAWHACEAKPYAIDAFSTVLILALFAASQNWATGARLAAFALCAPFLLFLTYPALFVYAGVLAAFFPAAVRERRSITWLAFLGLASVVGGSFLVLYLGPIAAQRSAELVNYWAVRFPDWGRPWTVPGWACLALLELCRYCCKPWGQPLAVLFLIGVVVLWRRGDRSLVLLLVGPVAVAFLAACVRAYPVGGHRLMAYSVPLVILLIAAGAAPALTWLSHQHRWAAVPLILFLMTPAKESIGRLFSPWDRPAVQAAANYILEHHQPGEIVTGDTWESAYLLRQLGPRFQYPCAGFRETAERVSLVPAAPGSCRYSLLRSDHWSATSHLWMMVEAEDPTSRGLAEASAQAAGWSVQEATEFHHVWVLLLERSGASGAASACR
jgi:hypothetical protein